MNRALDAYNKTAGETLYAQNVNDGALDNDALALHVATDDPSAALARQLAANRDVAPGLLGADKGGVPRLVTQAFDPPSQ